MAMRKRRIEPMEDYGLFGPDSVAWRVWGYPTSLTVGFQRAVVVEELDPFLVASVTATQKIVTQPRTRYDRTIRYFATVAFADSRSIAKASEMLMKVHARNVGVEPVSGMRFDANNPDSQLWILLTGWHSVLYAYETYGPGKLSPEDEARYWEACATAAQLQTCDPADVPRTREGVRDYFRRMRPRLAAGEATQQTMHHLLNGDVVLPPLPRILRPGAWVATRFLRAATVATLPRWQRDLANLRQPRAVAVLIRPVMRWAFRAVAASARLQVLALSAISPSTVPIAGPALLGLPPEHAETVTPAEAFSRHGVPTPAELYAELGPGPAAAIAYPPSAPAPRAMDGKAAGRLRHPVCE
ncbi:MAG TPA: oxygenase MpaB family protein [Solirubrobacteraceae bacterium]|nr:oxygenase MpaB family protein [Solirubrobacteraceae bacterium]